MKNKAHIIDNTVTTITRKTTAIGMWSRKCTWKASLQLEMSKKTIVLFPSLASSLALLKTLTPNSFFFPFFFSVCVFLSKPSCLLLHVPSGGYPPSSLAAREQPTWEAVRKQQKIIIKKAKAPWGSTIC